MTPEEINAIASLPVIGVLIYVIIRLQSQVDKLLQVITDMSEKHANDMIEMACTDVGHPPTPPPPPREG